MKGWEMVERHLAVVFEYYVLMYILAHLSVPQPEIPIVCIVMRGDLYANVKIENKK